MGFGLDGCTFGSMFSDEKSSRSAVFPAGEERSALCASSAAETREKKTASAAAKESVRDPVVATSRARLLETIRSRRLELARVVPTRRALELALEQPEALAALDALRAGTADPSPAAALACHLVRAVLDGDGAAEDEGEKTATEEDIAAAVLGDAFSGRLRPPDAATRAERRSESFLGTSTSPGAVRAALARCVVAGDETRALGEPADGEALDLAAAAAAEFAAAFDAIRPALGRTLPSRMRGAELAAANARGLRAATRAVRALMMGGGFGALAEDDDADGGDDDETRGGFERDTYARSSPGSNDPLAEALFRWSACAVREWRLRRAAETAEAELARAADDGGGGGGASVASRHEPSRHERSPRGKTRRAPLVVRAPPSPRDARKVATHGGARAPAVSSLRR